MAKQYTVKQEIKKLRLRQWILFAITWLAVITPISIIVITKWDSWIVNNPEKTSVATGGIITFITLFIAALKVAKAQNSTITKSEKQKAVGAFASLTIGWLLVAIIFTLLESILSDLIFVLWYELIGLVVASCTYYICKYNKEKADRYSSYYEKEDVVYRIKKERKANGNEEDIGGMLG